MEKEVLSMNYQLVLDTLIKELVQTEKVPTLLLHACCAPCSSYVLEYLSNYFKITIFYYNPNITEKEEYHKRVEEEKRLLQDMNFKYPVHFIEGKYDPESFFKMAEGKEDLQERGERCYDCYHLRLKETAKVAKEQGFDYFGTTLSVSPHKNSNWLNEIGKELSEEVKVPYLYSDFKKKEGYKRSIELSKQYHLYRQNYCGCIYSKRQSEQENRGLVYEG